MLTAISVLFVLVAAYGQYRQAKLNGRWSWLGFVAVLGSMLVFLAAFLIPVVNSTTLRARPGLMVTVILGGIFIFVGTLVLVCRKYYARFFPVKGSPATTPPGQTPQL